MRLQQLLFIFLFIFFFAFFLFRATVVQDPDFGWHVQSGRLFINRHTISMNDPFSYTMPSYYFVDHEWGTDIMIALLYGRFGMMPLQVLFALLGILVLFFLGKGTDERWRGVLLFLAGGTLFEFVGTRPQVITWVLVALLTSLIFQKTLWLRWRFFIPLLFLFWANLHGGFAIGFVVLYLFLFGNMLEKRRIDAKDSGVIVLSFFATLCNPYGYHLWIEVTKSATDPALRWVIQEWYPAIYFTNIAFWIYAALSSFLLVRYYRKFSFTTVGIYGLFFLSAMASMRNIPIFIIVSFYPTARAMSLLYEEAGKHLYGKERFIIGYRGFFLVCLFLFLPQLAAFTYGIVGLHEGQNSYPTGAIAYLHQHKTHGQIFSSYDWGGYLVWQLPEKKVFIDGRMPSWRNPSASSKESTYAFGDYQQILKKEVSFASISQKYGIDTVLVSASDLHEQHLKMFGIDISKSAFLKRFFGSPLSFAQVVSQVKQMGWKEVYQDKTAVVFENTK